MFRNFTIELRFDKITKTEKQDALWEWYIQCNLITEWSLCGHLTLMRKISQANFLRFPMYVNWILVSQSLNFNALCIRWLQWHLEIIYIWRPWSLFIVSWQLSEKQAAFALLDINAQNKSSKLPTYDILRCFAFRGSNSRELNIIDIL